MAAASTLLDRALSDKARAACIAAVLATIISALRLAATPGSSASAMARAEAVRFSIWELAADSERINTAANGAMSSPSSASNRVISRLAASASAWTAGGRSSVRAAMAAGTAG